MPKTTPVTYLSTLLAVAQDDLAQARANHDRAIEAKMQHQQALNHATTDAEHYAGKINEIVQTIKTIGGNVKGFKPTGHAIGNVEPETSDAPDYKSMTVRASLRAYFTGNNNDPAHYRDVAEVIGKSKGTVASTLSIYPEFIANNLGSGQWLLDPSFLNAGWTTVGK